MFSMTKSMCWEESDSTIKKSSNINNDQQSRRKNEKKNKSNSIQFYVYIFPSDFECRIVFIGLQEIYTLKQRQEKRQKTRKTNGTEKQFILFLYFFVKFIFVSFLYLFCLIDSMCVSFARSNGSNTTFVAVIVHFNVSSVSNRKKSIIMSVSAIFYFSSAFPIISYKLYVCICACLYVLASSWCRFEFT